MWNRDKSEAGVVAAPVMGTAALHAGGVAAERADALELEAAAGAFVKVARLHPVARQRKVVRSLFTRQAEVGAGLLPFLSVGIDPLSSHTILSEEVRELVAQRAIDLVVSKDRQPRIERDQVTAGKSHARGVAQPRIPAKHKFARQGGRAGLTEEL